jgi:hypothetical protein
MDREARIRKARQQSEALPEGSYGRKNNEAIIARETTIVEGLRAIERACHAALEPTQPLNSADYCRQPAGHPTTSWNWNDHAVGKSGPGPGSVILVSPGPPYPRQRLDRRLGPSRSQRGCARPDAARRLAGVRWNHRIGTAGAGLHRDIRANMERTRIPIGLDQSGDC